MKILCVIDSLGSGGAQRQLVALAIGLKERGHQVSFLVYHDINFFSDVLEDAGIGVFKIIEPNYLKRLYKMRRYIRRSNCNAVLSFLEAANFICEVSGLPWKRWKLIVGERSANPAILKSFKLKLYRWFHLTADFVVANSYTNLQIVQKINPLLSEKNCKVIYNIIDPEKWRPTADYVPLKDGKLNLVVAASHQYLKNAKGLIEAVNRLNQQEKLRLKIDWYGGKSPDDSYEQSKALILKYNLQKVFFFHPATANILKKMQYGDVIGLFSFYEGLPNVVCEAIVLGKPVIASNVSDIPTLLKNERNFIFNPKSVEQINLALKYVLSLTEDHLTWIGRMNRNNSIPLFNRNNIVSSYESLLE